VRGYLPAPPEVKKNLMDLNVEQETLRELAARSGVLIIISNIHSNADL
jgi:hypothetical protein